MPLWRLLQLATTTLTSETPAPHSAMCALCCVAPARNASSTLREASFTSHTARCLSLFSISVLILGVGRLPMLNPVNREAVPLVHTFYMYVYVLVIFHTPLSFERESRQKRFSCSATREAAKWGKCENNCPRSRYSCNRRVFRNYRGHGPHGPRVGYVLFWKFFFGGSKFRRCSGKRASISFLPCTMPLKLRTLSVSNGVRCVCACLLAPVNRSCCLRNMHRVGSQLC